MSQRSVVGGKRSWVRWFATLALLAVSFVGVAEQTATPNGGQAKDEPAAQAPMTKQQAKELFRSVDEILSFASSDTNLPIEHP